MPFKGLKQSKKAENEVPSILLKFCCWVPPICSYFSFKYWGLQCVFLSCFFFQINHILIVNFDFLSNFVNQSSLERQAYLIYPYKDLSLDVCWRVLLLARLSFRNNNYFLWTTNEWHYRKSLLLFRKTNVL